MSWDWWWSLNKERYINLKATVRARGNSDRGADLNFGDEASRADQALARAQKIRRRIVPILGRAAQDDDYRVRTHAAIALGKVGFPARMSYLLAGLSDPHPEVRESMVLALGLIGDDRAIKPLADMARDTREGRRLVGNRKVSSGTRAVAAIALGLAGLYGSADATPMLIDLMNGRERNADVNVAAAMALGIMQSRESAQALATVLADKNGDGYLRANAANALGKIGDRASLSLMVASVGDRNSHVRRSAAIALGRLARHSDTKAVEVLTRVARSDADRATRNFAIMSLGEIGGQKARDFLVKLVRRGGTFEKSYGALALGVYGWHHDDPEEDAIAKLLLKELASNKSCKLRGAEIIALGLLGHRSAETDVLEILNEHGHADLRVHAAISLGLLRSRDAVPALRDAARERSNVTVRQAAAIGLGLIGDHRATEVLAELVASEASIAIRGAAIRGMGLIGDGRVAIGLCAILSDRSGKYPDATRAFAAVSLGLLGDKDDLPALSRITEGTNYTSQKGALSRLMGRL